MKALVVSLFCTMLLVGCSSSRYTVGPKESQADYDYEEFNKSMDDRECRVIFTNGSAETVHDVVASEDSISWITLVRRVTTKSQVSVIRRVQGKAEATVTMASGETRSTDEVNVTADSVSWMDWSRLGIPMSQVSRVFYVNHSRAFKEGLGVGLLLGGMTFSAVSSSGGSEALVRFFAGLGAGAAVFIVSAVVGGVGGHTEEYEFHRK
ncbi:MAG: hypothetical protein WBD36_11600 [Bacteroidota bacterium]